MYYIPKYKLIRIVQLLDHFHLNKYNLNENFKDEKEFWNMLYKHDIININNTNNLALTCSINNILYNKNFNSIYTKKENCYRINSFKISIKSDNILTIVNIYPKHSTILIIDNILDKLLLVAKCKGNNLLNWNIKKMNISVKDNAYYKLQEIIYILTNGFQSRAIKEMNNLYYKRNFNDININMINYYNLEQFLNKNYYKYKSDEILQKVFESANNKILEVNQRKQETDYICNILLIKCFNIINNYYNININNQIIQNNKEIFIWAPIAYKYYNDMIKKSILIPRLCILSNS